MKIFVSVPVDSLVQKSFFTASACAYLEKNFSVMYSSSLHHLQPEEIRFYASDADVIMTGWSHTKLTADILAGTSIKVIAHTGGSVADYVADDVFDAGIRVISGNELYAESVAEGTLGYMLMALRAMPEQISTVQNGGWQPSFSTEGLFDQTVGIIGFSTVSKKLITLLRPFRVKVKIFSGHAIDPQWLTQTGAEQTSMEDIFASCKLVSLHSSLQPRTRAMIRKKHFDLLQDNAIFLNTARGPIVHEMEMIDSLRENRFRAVLDVYDKEPLALDSPLRKLPNVYCFPHQAGPTIDRRPVVVAALAEDLLRFSRGEPMLYEITSQQAARMTTMQN